MRNVYNVKDGKRAYLQCKGVRRLHNCCNNKAIRLDELEEVLLNAINDLLDNYYDKEKLENEYNIRESKNANDEEIQILEQEKVLLNKKIEEEKTYYRKLYEDKANLVITEDMFKMLSSDYTKEIEEMNRRISVIDEEIESLKQRLDNKKQARDILKKYKHISKLNKVIVDEFIDKVYIGVYDKETKSRDIEIEWNFEF